MSTVTNTVNNTVTEVDPMSWAEMEFGTCELGDKRRTKRLIKLGAQVLARPDGSSPTQTESWGDCKAMYRFMSCEDVSFEAITGPHFQQTRQSGESGQVRLIISDTTEINYGSKRHVQGLKPVGRNTGRGYFLHSALMRDPDSEDVIGLAGQEILYRKPRPKGKKKGAKNSRRRDPERESAVWGRLIDQVGPAPEGVKWLHVCDRAADDYEVFLRAYHQGCGWVIRSCRLNRNIITPANKTMALGDYLKTLPLHDGYELPVAATAKRPARTAKLELRFGQLAMPIPSASNAWIRENYPGEPLTMWVVEVVETNPPAGADPVRWVLLTSERVETVEQALQVVDYYSQRWVIEEYHKALKTGCHVEERYYRTAPRLERVTGLLAIVAVQLVRMRQIATQTPDRPAHEVVPVEWVETLAKVRRRPRGETMTIAQFVKHLGGLGGHLGRKHDGRPGWITLWRGMEKLLLILRGIDVAKRKCG